MKERENQKKIGALLGIALFNLVLIIFLWKRNEFGFQELDDYLLSTIPSGVYGEHSPYMIFNNVIYGYVLSILYTYFPMCNWMTLLYVLISYVAYNLLGYIVIQNTNEKLGALLSIIFSLATFSSLYREMNFTKFAAFFCAIGYAGIVYVTSSVIQKRIINVCIGSLSCFLVIWGSYIRLNAFYMVSAFVVVVMFIRLLYEIKESGMQHGRTVTEYIKQHRIIWLCLIIVLVSVLFDNNLYKQDAGWAYSREFNEVRAQLLDYGILDYDKHPDEYSKLGLSRTDIEMLWNCRYGDLNVFNVSLLRSLLEIKETEEREQSLYNQVLVAFSSEYLRMNMMIIVVILAVIYIIIGNKHKVYVISGMILMICELVYLNVMGRTPERVLFIPMMSCLVVILMAFRKSEEYGSRLTDSLMVLLVIDISFGNLLNTSESTSYTVDRDITMQYLSTIMEDDALYIWDISSPKVRLAYDPFDCFVDNSLQNSVYDGSWLVPSPIMDAIQEPYTGDLSLYEALVEKDNIFIIGNRGIDMKLDFIRQHYGNDISYCIYKNAPRYESVAGYEIYSFTRNIENKEYASIQWCINAFERDLNNPHLINIDGQMLDDFDHCNNYLQVECSNGKEYTYQVYCEENGVFHVSIATNDILDCDTICINFIKHDSRNRINLCSKKTEIWDWNSILEIYENRD